MIDLLKLSKKIHLVFLLVLLSFAALSCKKENVDDNQEQVDNQEQTVSLDKEAATLRPKAELVIKPVFAAGVTPKKTYTWSTDNAQAVDILVNSDNSVKVTAKQKGNAKITLTSTDGKLTASCQITVEDTPDDGVLRILTIGNSFSDDAVEHYLYDLAKADNKAIVIGNLVIAGASLELHWQNASKNTKAYDYRKINQQGIKSNKFGTSIEMALAEEEWDYISFQQASPNSGQYETYVTPLPLLYNYVKQKATNSTVKFILHQTWAYAKDSYQTAFADYGNNQLTMYNAIIDANTKAKNLVNFDLWIPTGTAIQNGRTSVIGDNFCRDGMHLDLNIGRYTASCTWFEALFGKSVIGNTSKPAALTDYEVAIAQNAAHLAILKPAEITTMTAFQNPPAGVGTLKEPTYIDFAQTAAVQGWNGLSGFIVGSSILNLKDKNGSYTGVSLTVTERFNDKNAGGEKVTTTPFNMSGSISSALFFGNSKGGAFNGLSIIKSTIKLSGFDKTKKYNLCFFGSRELCTDNRETKYISKGKNEAVAYLNAANNKTNVSCTNTIEPDANGEITVTITAGENNTNPNGFYYLNAMEISLAN